MYRVYDTKKKRYVKESIYLSPNNDLSTSQRAIFGSERLSLVSNQRYILQKDIGLYDVNKKLIFEGDIGKVETKDAIVVGVIAYYAEHACYYLFDYENNKYYPLNSSVCNVMEIIGNVNDNENLLPS